MANVRGARSGGVFGERKRSRNHVVEEFNPSSGWTEDSDHHYLLVDLPGFKKEEVKLQVLGSGEIVVSGERHVNEDKYIYFEKTVKVPENSDYEKITGKFNGEILYVTVRKKAIEKKKLQEKEQEKEKASTSYAENSRKETSNRNEKEEKGGTLLPEYVENTTEEKGSVWRSAEKMGRQHIGIIVTALVAFSLGLLVSHRIKLSRFTSWHPVTIYVYTICKNVMNNNVIC